MLNRQPAFYVYQNHLLRLRLLADIKFSTLISNLLQPHARLMIIFFTLMLSRMTVLNRIPLAALRNTNQPGSPTPQSIDLVLDKRH